MRRRTCPPWLRPDRPVKLLVILAVGLVAYFAWSRSSPIRRGGWRVGAGLFSAVLIVVGAVAAIVGKELPGLLLVAGGLALAFIGRVGRGALGRSKPAASSEPMSASEARSILGVEPEATTEAIKAAYARLMKRNHPDQGGTPGLASKLNAARDRLLKAR